MLMTTMAWHFHIRAEGSRGRFVGRFAVSSLRYLQDEINIMICLNY